MTTIIKIRDGVELLLSDEEARKIVLKELSGLVPETAKVSEEVSKTEEVSEPEQLDAEEPKSKKCLQCGSVMLKVRGNKKFCSDKCRDAFNNHKKSIKSSVLKLKPLKRVRHHKWWKPSEDKKLLSAVKKFGSNAETFKMLSKVLNRSVAGVWVRHSKLSKKSLKPASTPEIDFSKKLLVFDKNGNQARTSESKKCLQCGSLIDMSGFHSRNWYNVKFCGKKCRTEYHTGYHYDGSDERVCKSWTSTEDEQLIKELRAGGFTTFNYERIARLLHRSLSGVRCRVVILRKARGGRLW